MALLSMIFRKMTQNKWLEASLLMGLIITVGLVSSIPMYTEAILSRMLIKELESSQGNSTTYPGTLSARFVYSSSDADGRLRQKNANDSFVRKQVIPSMPVPLLASTYDVQSLTYTMKPDGRQQQSSKKTSDIRSKLVGVEGLEQHIKLVDGRMPEKKPVNGVYEVLVTEKGLNNLRAVLGAEFTLEDKTISDTIKIKPVGVFTKLNDDDLFFQSTDLGTYTSSVLIDRELLENDLLNTKRLQTGASGWYLVPDYSKLELRTVDQYLHAAAQLKQLVETSYNYAMDAKYLNVIDAYFERSSSLRILMWSLNVPVLAMLALYVFMVSNLITNRQRTEIAVIRSRGASRLQIMLSYMAEYGLLSMLAVAAGPPLGLFLTRVLGSSNGFMSFVQRTGIRVHLNSEVYTYAIITALAVFAIMLLPALQATRATIVGHKQQMARMGGTPFWHKLFLDVIALAIALYGLRVFHTRMKSLQTLGLTGSDLHIDPLQFAVPALFILGGGMLLLRIYPYFLRLVYWSGKKWWPPSIYATLIQVGRSSTGYQFLMIFLMMTIATGMFSASAARTINSNSEDRVHYAAGADVILRAQWPNDKPSDQGGGMMGAGQSSAPVPEVIHYVEPPFEPYTKLEGVEHTARVFIKQKAAFSSNGGSGTARLMGIDTDEFGMTSWFRNGLLPYPFYEYLNVLAPAPNAVLISKTLADKRGLKQGDTIYIGWEGVNQQPFVVYAIVDYFPTFSPVADGNSEPPMLIVGHRQQIQTVLSMEPYEVWLKLKPEASVSDLYRSIENSKLSLTTIDNTGEAINKAKSDPFLMAVNGALTLGFLISLGISFVGFLLYWLLVLRGRMLQNGIMRAMGLSLRQLLGMLTVEQLLTSGAAVGIGLLTGYITSRLFVPVFQNAFDAKTLVPPFIVTVDPTDSIRIYIFVGVMLLIGLFILGVMLSRLKIHQAIKLGED